MGKFTVSNAAELVAAIKQAGGGDTIYLNSGSYAAGSLQNLDFGGKGLTITSADAEVPAELTGLKLRNVSGVTFSKLTMTDRSASSLYDFTVRLSSDIHFDQVLIQGEGATGLHAAAPVMFRDNTNISVTNSEITNARYGISLLDNEGVLLADNYFHDLRTDAIRGGGNSDITITDNYFTEFHPAAGDHADAIQFWTGNTTESASNIVITNNVIALHGNGDPVQGIFLRDNAGGRPYRNVVIDGNTVIGALYNGIFVENADGLEVTNNVVIGTEQQGSWIRVNDVDTLEGNSAENFVVDGIVLEDLDDNEILLPLPGNSDLLGGLLGSAEDVLDALADAMSNISDTRVIRGTDGADRLKAGRIGDYLLIGGDGADVFTGGDNHTRMEGGSGNDIFYVNSARDTVVEGRGGGEDTVYTTVDYVLADNVETLRISAAKLTVHGNDGDNRIVGSAGADTVHGGDGDDSIQGLGGDDVLYGEDGDDALSGGDGRDRLFGGNGDDRLVGGGGDDRLEGGVGDDWIEGGAGADILVGGRGADLFYFRPADLRGVDTITDFSSVEGDTICLALIDANIRTSRDDAFTFIGDRDFSRVAGQLHYVRADGGILIEGDVNGDARADFAIFLRGRSYVLASDFML